MDRIEEKINKEMQRSISGENKNLHIQGDSRRSSGARWSYLIGLCILIGRLDRLQHKSLCTTVSVGIRMSKSAAQPDD